MESELFGHVRGSFTGAATTKIGLIESANGGTAFFDEIGELPLDLQTKLLRVLQEKEFRPVGAISSKRSDFRVIAATNRNLISEVDKGAFRRDLFYRLNVVSLRLVPLRDRKDDIPLLIGHFLALCGSGHHLTQEALDALMSYDWPGNVRELEHCLQHMVALNSGPLLHVGALPSAVQNHLRAQRGKYLSTAVGVMMTGSGVTVQTVEPPPVPIPIAEMERRAIAGALAYTKGDRAVAAQMLGIGRTTLYRKIKEYQLETDYRLPM
jgi:transcriptional regulator with PAS, ATPase and Fis domain